MTPELFLAEFIVALVLYFCFSTITKMITGRILSRPNPYNETPLGEGPYRTSAVVQQEQPELIKPEKVKREFKMPSIKLGKHTKTFGYMLPICGSFLGMGMLHDAPLLGDGVKWGGGLALGALAIFFFVLLIGNATNGKAWE